MPLIKACEMHKAALKTASSLCADQLCMKSFSISTLKRVKCFTGCEEQVESTVENTHRSKSGSHAKHI